MTCSSCKTFVTTNSKDGIPMHRYSEADKIEALPLPKRRQMVNNAVKYTAVAAFTTAAALATVKGWQLILEDVERLKAERGLNTVQFQPSTFEPNAPGE